MHRFVIDDRHEDGRAYEVRVYPTRAAYLRACLRREPGRSHFQSHATCFHLRRITIFADGDEVESPIVGAIYVHEEMLDGEIISHECTHAALDLFRLRHRGVAALGRNESDVSSEREEELALSIGRLGQAIADKMWELKVWTRPSAKKRGT